VIDDDRLDAAADAVARGEAVVYPTETVYGLGADALSAPAVEGVFELKNRPRDRPVSLAVPDVDSIEAYAEPTGRERAFAEAFLPGPVTLVLRRDPSVPDVLTAGRERVGVRVPDHPVARALLERVAPLTATSANRSGQGSARRVEEVDERVREGAVVLDDGETPGGESTVVDLSAGEILRRGALAGDIEDWLSAQ
jgi:L-threonylcarbamoyladenylate synthase